MDENDLLKHLDKLHTTPLGAQRIRKNLALTAPDVITWCQQTIQSPAAKITRQGKNWYVEANDCRLTIHAHSYTIITAHKIKDDL